MPSWRRRTWSTTPTMAMRAVTSRRRRRQRW